MIAMPTWIKANWLLLAVLVIMSAAFILLRNKPSHVASYDELNGLLSAGRPTLVEFYSNF
jgi:hypothetical protein